MDNQRVTIIIPVYNVEPYVVECLQSVMRQTYQGPLECILVDDCGTDNSTEVAEKLIAEYDGSIEFKVLHHDHNRGLSAARNTGMDASTGDYVYFLDSDDWISDDCIEKLAKPLQQERYDIVVGDYESEGEPRCVLELSLSEGQYHEKGINKTFCNQGVYVMAWNKMYRKSFLEKNQLRFDEGKIHEDEILAFELCCIEKSFYVVKSVTYHYRIRENSIITQSDVKKKLIGYIGVLQSVREKIKWYNDFDGIYDFYLFWVWRCAQWISRIEIDERVFGWMEEQIPLKGYLDVVPNLRCLHNKHNRLLYYSCKENQTYSRLYYVTKMYANKLCGRVMRNVLSLFPVKC